MAHARLLIAALLTFAFAAGVHQLDLGELLEITPERAMVVNDTIWEVVDKHP